MSNYLDSLGNAVIDRSPAELIAAVIIALGLSLVLAGLDFLGRRKVRDALMPMIVLLIVANLASMAIAAGYFAYMGRLRGSSWMNKTPPGVPGADPGLMARRIFRAADKNRDGLLSTEEASVAAADFVRKVDTSGEGLIDTASLERALPASGIRRGRGMPGRGPFRLPPGRLPSNPTSPPSPGPDPALPGASLPAVEKGSSLSTGPKKTIE